MPIITEVAQGTPEAFEVKTYGGEIRYAIRTHVGCVLAEFEKNGSSDSDFFAIVWDNESESIKAFEYGSTRHGGYYGCEVDATPEVIAKAKALKAEYEAEYEAEYTYLMNGYAEKGNLATIANATGKYARFNGSQGTIFWVGEDKYAPQYKSQYGTNMRVGIEVNGEKIFLSGDCIHTNNHEKNHHDIIRALRVRANVAGYNPIYRLQF
jgi:hypothetical protein